MTDGPSISPAEALDRLKAGNQRFVDGEMTHGDCVDAEHREALTEGQAPYASVLTCADSRVSPTHVFDAGLGELFVCRNAGNLVDGVTLGSIEYAAAHTGCPLVCVLGHSQCGAVQAALQTARDPGSFESPSVGSIVRWLLPAVLAARQEGDDREPENEQVVRKNVQMVCEHIRENSPVLRPLIARGDFQVVGAYYDLGSGRVEFLAR